MPGALSPLEPQSLLNSSVPAPFGVVFDVGPAGLGGLGGGDDVNAGRGQAGERGEAVQFAQ